MAEVKTFSTIIQLFRVCFSRCKDAKAVMATIFYTAQYRDRKMKKERPFIPIAPQVSRHVMLLVDKYRVVPRMHCQESF